MLSIHNSSVYVHYPLSADDFGRELFPSTGSNLPLILTDIKEFERVLQSKEVLDHSIAAEWFLKVISHYSIVSTEFVKCAFAGMTGTQNTLKQYQQQFVKFRGNTIRVPDIAPEVLIEVTKNRNLEFCFFKVLSHLKENLLNDSRVEALSVSKLHDPEGTELRIYFEVQTTILSYHDRRKIRTKLEKLIDHVVEEVVGDEHYVAFRVIFGVTVEQRLDE